jgi:excisionase family DNA binding protein
MKNHDFDPLQRYDMSRHSINQLAEGGLATIAFAARFLSVSRAWLYAEMASGRLPFVRVGSHRRIHKATLLAIASNGLPAPPDEPPKTPPEDSA